MSCSVVPNNTLQKGHCEVISMGLTRYTSPHGGRTHTMSPGCRFKQLIFGLRAINWLSCKPWFVARSKQMSPRVTAISVLHGTDGTIGSGKRGGKVGIGSLGTGLLGGRPLGTATQRRCPGKMSLNVGKMSASEAQKKSKHTDVQDKPGFRDMRTASETP